ncbi:hypothetical protein CIW52_18395 [Mycolicibacterium sp. P9-64]|uniref:hypothetical protein n=1 Tax=Mycolicibacterium sp. P9-64 TaxID=2024612 RepID=UPI0011EED5B9|nr:hypothetical protein [Mycolicibacterium sp. P9-64]KAA0081709.1 hypothetical protein CIW52_18395 [Mycolicibacterium sp. P9-64]
MTILSKVRSAIALVGAALALSIGVAPTAAADPLDYVVHTEHVQVGPYSMKVGFTVWPIRAMQSLDFTFEPEGGIADKSGTITEIAPDGRSHTHELSRHPRNRSIWGLDVRSLDAAGTWALRFEIEGPRGPGTGELTIDVLKQPGPPLPLSWAIGLIPLGLAVAFYVAVWVRTGSPNTRQ